MGPVVHTARVQEPAARQICDVDGINGNFKTSTGWGAGSTRPAKGGFPGAPLLCSITPPLHSQQAVLCWLAPHSVVCVRNLIAASWLHVHCTLLLYAAVHPVMLGSGLGLPCSAPPPLLVGALSPHWGPFPSRLA